MNMRCNDYGFYAPTIVSVQRYWLSLVFPDVKGEKYEHSITFQCTHVFDTDSGPDYIILATYSL